MNRLSVSRQGFAAGLVDIESGAREYHPKSNSALLKLNNFGQKRMNGIYKRSGSVYFTSLNDVNFRTFEWKYRVDDTSLVVVRPGTSDIEIISAKYGPSRKQTITVPDFSLTIPQLASLKYFFIEYSLWLFVPAGSKFYEISVFEGAEFQFNQPILRQFPVGEHPCYPLSEKSNLRISNAGNNSLKLEPLMADDMGLIDRNIFSQEDVGREITFEFRVLVNPDSHVPLDRRLAYWIRGVINSVSADFTSATMSIIKSDADGSIPIPDGYITTHWMIDAFCSQGGRVGRLGVPDVVVYYKGRLVLFCGSWIFISRASDFPLSFKNGAGPADAYTIRINAGRVFWAISFSYLVIGTQEGVYVVHSFVTEGTGTSVNVSGPARICNIGACEIPAVLANNTVIFVAKDKFSIFELRLLNQAFVPKLISKDFKTFGDDNASGNYTISAIAWCQFPEPTLFITTESNNIAGFLVKDEIDPLDNIEYKAFKYQLGTGGSLGRVIGIVSTGQENEDTLWVVMELVLSNRRLLYLASMVNFFNSRTQYGSEQCFLDFCMRKTLHEELLKITSAPINYYSFQTQFVLSNIVARQDVSCSIMKGLGAESVTTEETDSSRKGLLRADWNEDKGKFAIYYRENSDQGKANEWGQPIIPDDAYIMARSSLIIEEILNVNGRMAIRFSNIPSIIGSRLLEMYVSIGFKDNYQINIPDALYAFLNKRRYRLSPLDYSGFEDPAFDTFYFEDVEGPIDYLPDIPESVLMAEFAERITVFLGDNSHDYDGNYATYISRFSSILKPDTVLFGVFRGIKDATGFNNVQYSLYGHFNGEQLEHVVLGHKKYQIPFKVDQTEILDDTQIKIVAVTAFNGKYNFVYPTGDINYFVEWLYRNEIAHLIGFECKLQVDGRYYKNTSFVLTSDMFEPDPFGRLGLSLRRLAFDNGLKDLDFVGIQVTIGLEYESECMGTIISIPNAFQSLAGRPLETISTSISYHATHGGEISHRQPTGNDDNSDEYIMYPIVKLDALEDPATSFALRHGTKNAIKLNRSHNVNELIFYIRHNEQCNAEILDITHEFDIGDHMIAAGSGNVTSIADS